MDDVILKSGRKITLLPRTRRVTEAVNNAMFKGVVIESGMDASGELVMKDMPIPMTNSLAAESIAVELLSGLTHDEFLDLEDEDYDTIKKAIDARDKAKKNRYDRAIKWVKSFLKWGSNSLGARLYTDYVLMAKLWHCTPSEFLEQDQYMIDLHAGIYTAEIKKIELERKRAEQ